MHEIAREGLVECRRGFVNAGAYFQVGGGVTGIAKGIARVLKFFDFSEIVIYIFSDGIAA